MSMKYFGPGALALILAYVLMSRHWAGIDEENNAFARDCATAGGQVRMEYGMRQCVGARRKEGA